MDIYPLQVFMAVYSNRSFSRAAKELHLSQPSVSAHVKKLEEELGVALFDRVGRKTIPTREGDLLFLRGQEIIDRLQEVKNELTGLGRSINGLITLGASGIPGSYIIPALASDFKKTYPDVFFQVQIKDSPEILAAVSRGELSLGIVDENPAGKDLIPHHQIHDELVLATAPGFHAGKTISPLKLMGIPLLIREEGSEARKSMEKQHLLHRVSLKALNVTAILGSTDSLREAVKAGLGAAIISRFVIRDDLKTGLLKEVRIRGIRMRRTFYVVSHRKRILPPQYRAFVDFLRETASD